MKSITQDPDIRSGVPCLTGHRVPIAMILAELAGGANLRDVCEDRGLDHNLVASAMRELAGIIDKPFSLPDDEQPLTCQRLVDRGWTERPFGRDRHFDFGDITLVQVFGKTMPTHWEMYMRGFNARMSKVPKTMRDVRALEQLRKDEP